MVNGDRSTRRTRLLRAAALGAALWLWFGWFGAGPAAQGTVTSNDTIARGAWTWIGPGNFAGRMHAIAAHPDISLTLLAGGADGGIWKTTDGGATWTNVDDFMPTLAVSTIVFKPGDADIVLAGTGDGFYNADAVIGDGIFKSTDGGNTWAQLPSTATNDFSYVNRLAYSADGRILLAATRTGLFRSTDDGTSWSAVLNPASSAGGSAGHADVADVKFLGGSSTNAVAAGFSSNVYYSSDGGLTWQISIHPGVDTSSAFHRVELGITQTQSNIVYISLDDVSPSGHDFVPSGQIWQSTDSGHSFAVINDVADLYQYGLTNNALWVDPFNAQNIIAGGMDVWTSTNGGSSFAEVTDSYSPASVQPLGEETIVADGGYNGTSNKRVYVATNRGIYRTDDWTAVNFNTGGFVSLDNNLGTTQFYSGAVTASGAIIGGTANNGTLLYTPSAGPQGWTAVHFDNHTLQGGYVAADPGDANYLYGEDAYLQIVRSSDGGSTSSYIYGDNGNGACKAAPYRIDDACSLGQSPEPVVNAVAPFVLDPNNSSTLLAGGQSLWRTTDVKTATTSTTGPTWSAIKSPSPAGCGAAFACAAISTIAIAKTNSNEIFVGYSDGELWVTTNGTAASPSWSEIGTSSLPSRALTRVVVDPSNASRVYAAFGTYASPNLFTSADGGATWSAIAGSGSSALPASPVHALAINPSNASVLYAGTDDGVFESDNGGAAWTVPQEGPTNARVDDLFWSDSTTLVAATHGRGMFTFNTNAACTSATTVSPGSGSFGGAGGSGTISVTTGAACSWTATSNVSFVTITSGASGTGSGTIGYTVAATGAIGSRSGAITVNGATFAITQDANVTIAPTALHMAATRAGISGAIVASSEPQTVTIAFDSGSTAWSISADQPWVQLSATSGSGSGSVSVSLATGSVPAGTRSGSSTLTLLIPSLSLTERIPLTLTTAVSAAATDPDGDGKGDLTVYRGSTGTWYTLQSASGFSAMGSAQFGVAGDLPVPGDYDGDGKADQAVFRPATGVWYIKPSSTGTAVSYGWGVGTDIPVPGDYDGDGKTDLAVYRPSTGTWWILTSSSNYASAFTVEWGQHTDIPVVGDFDGDGTTDIAVWRPSNGTWYVRKSSTSWTTTMTAQWGLPGDIPVPGDYDGDATTDYAVYRPSTGMWYIEQSSTGFSTSASYQWGLPDDTPVPADYDGDGKVDIAVWRPSNGTWYFKLSTSGFASSSSFQWGLPGDTPVPTALTSEAMAAADRTVANVMRNGDFDGDGRADMTVYRPSAGQWFNLRSGYSFTTENTFQWGLSTDIPVPGDYDGDGQTDVALWRPGDGSWWILTSDSNYASAATFSWGEPGDTPLAADFDGDGRSDIAVWRPSNGTWYIRTSSTNFVNVVSYQWGLNGDVPVPGDYDGDGISDLAVFRPSEGTWYVELSSTGFTTSVVYQFGLNGDVPVPGDYDGDGKTDIAVYRPSTGTWYVLESSSEFTSWTWQQWGLAGDEPVPGDYDGDGKIDFAVFRPSTNTWFVLTSASGYSTTIVKQWGLAGDVPILGRQ